MSSGPLFAPYDRLAAGPDGTCSSFGNIVEDVPSFMARAAHESVQPSTRWIHHSALVATQLPQPRCCVALSGPELEILSRQCELVFS